MAEEEKPTQTGSHADRSSEQRTQDQARAAKPSSLTADAEKDAQVEAAKARVAAVKEAAQAAPGAPKAPVKKKEEGPKPTDAAAHPLVAKLREKFAGAVIDAAEFLGQLSIRIEPARVVEVCDALKRDPETPFNYLSDLTCAHYPDHREAPFEVIYNLYSISANERVRLKAWVNTEGAGGIDSVTGVWPSADWPEREVYDLFGVNFRNHPDLRRILLPPGLGGAPVAQGLSAGVCREQVDGKSSARIYQRPTGTVRTETRIWAGNSVSVA
jgi:NADH-quinone oxidoreductase subunit C